MAKFQDIFNKYLFFGLFILAMTSFIIIVQGDNGAPQPMGADSRVDLLYDNLTKAINDSERESKTQYGVFNDEQPKTGFGSIVLFGIVAVGKTTGSIISNFFGIIIKLPLAILQIDLTIMSVFMTWAAISIVLALWLLYKLGG